MNDLKILARLSPLLVSALLLLAGCSGNSYQPLPDNLNSLLKGGTTVDTLFVRAMSAASAAEFDTLTGKYLKAYARDFDDPGLSRFDSRTPYSLRQDSLIFLMQDYLLNTYRYDESIDMGRLLDTRLTGRLADTPLHSAALGDLGVAFFYQGNLEDAIKYQRAGYEIDMKVADPQLMSSDLNQLAAMCLRSDKYELARDYILAAIREEEPLGRPAPLAIRYGLASEIYLKLKDYPTAAKYARKALDLDRSEGRDAKVGIRLSQLAAIQFAQNDDQGAEKSLEEALPLLKKSNNVNSLSIANCQLGELALKRGDISEAQQYFYEALLLCRSAGIKPIEKRALHGLWLSMKDTNPSLGAEYLEHYSALSDSLGTVDSDSQLANLKAEFATRELRMDNERLEAQNRVNRIIIAGSAVLLVLLCLVGFLIYRNRTARQRLMRHMESVRINFFTNITHEFRTPLTVILGLSSELEKNEAVRREAALISEEGNNLLALVNQLLDIGKISSAAGNAQWRHGNIIGYLNMLVESLRPLAENRNTEIVFTPEANNVQMDFVPDYIRKIVVNILSNALRYVRPDGNVYIDVHTVGSDIVLRFADDGTGIDAEDLEHIFEPFYQGANSKTSVGTGVGLSLVKLLVQSMDGDITVKSNVKVGTVFTVTLPLKHAGEDIKPFDCENSLDNASQNVPVPNTDDDEIIEEGERKRPVVLIVEDNTNVSSYVASQLSDLYQIYTAANGEQGINKAINIVPDLIITDVMMPVMDGMTMVRQMRQNDILNHLPVIMLTAKAADSDRIEGITAGADAYLNKPFKADELRALAAHLIHQRRLLCEKFRDMAEQIAGVTEESSSEDRVYLGRLVNVIYHILNTEHRTDLNEIAKQMGTSERSLARRVQALTGESTVAFINRLKIDRAKRILDKDNTSTLAEIATRCGFDDPAYFSRIFKQNEGVTPTTYRRHFK